MKTATEAEPVLERELTEDEAAHERMMVAIAMTVVFEVAAYRWGCWRRARAAAGGPPLLRPAGRAGYTDGYRDGVAAARVQSGAGSMSDADLTAAARVRLGVVVPPRLADGTTAADHAGHGCSVDPA